MISLKDLLVCPVCHNGLPLNEPNNDEPVKCSQCERSYSFQHWRLQHDSSPSSR